MALRSPAARPMPWNVRVFVGQGNFQKPCRDSADIHPSAPGGFSFPWEGHGDLAASHGRGEGSMAGFRRGPSLTCGHPDLRPLPTARAWALQQPEERGSHAIVKRCRSAQYFGGAPAMSRSFSSFTRRRAALSLSRATAASAAVCAATARASRSSPCFCCICAVSARCRAFVAAALAWSCGSLEHGAGVWRLGCKHSPAALPKLLPAPPRPSPHPVQTACPRVQHEVLAFSPGRRCVRMPPPFAAVGHRGAVSQDSSHQTATRTPTSCSAARQAADAAAAAFSASSLSAACLSLWAAIFHSLCWCMACCCSRQAWRLAASRSSSFAASAAFFASWPQGHGRWGGVGVVLGSSGARSGRSPDNLCRGGKNVQCSGIVVRQVANTQHRMPESVRPVQSPSRGQWGTQTSSVALLPAGTESSSRGPGPCLPLPRAPRPTAAPA